MRRKRPSCGAALILAFLLFYTVASSYPALGAEPLLVADVEANDAYSRARSYLPDSGAYRLRNVGTGLYLTAFPPGTEEAGGYYICAASEDSHQIFVLTRQSDQSYVLVSQGDGSYLAAPGATHGSLAVLSPEDGEETRFSVIRLDEGGYLISPMHSSDQSLALCSSSVCAEADGVTALAGLTTFSGAATECWYLEEVPVLSVTMTRETLSLTAGQGATLDLVMSPARIEGSISWLSDNAAVASVDTAGRVIAHKNGSATIFATLGGLTASCAVTVSDISADAFFSQHNFTDGGWDVLPLTSLRFSGKRFAIERYNYNADWLDESCKLCCDAMLLKNLGAVMTTGYDFRTGQTDNLTPDPYITALANTGNYGATNAQARLYGDPVSMNLPRVLSRFTVNGAPLACTTQRGVTRAQIKTALESHPEGVIVEFYRSETLRHFLVFTECVNPDDPSGNYDFIVCDPAAYDRSLGDHVLFEDSMSYRNIGYRYSHMVSMCTITVLSTVEYRGSLRGNKIMDSRIQ